MGFRAIAITLIVLLTSALCALLYQNIILISDNVALEARLAEEVSRRNAAEALYEELLESYRDLSSEAERLRELYNELLANYSALNEDHDALKREYMSLASIRIELEAAYMELNRSYTELLKKTAVLESIARDYEELRRKYETLLSENMELKARYERLYKPLWSNMTITPSIKELREWLAEDDTDKIPYREWDFVCGDFAVMLSMRAKLRGWDMGIVAVLGRDAYGKDFAHTFNAIRCREGLVYVEPQNDQIFYGPIREGRWYNHPGYGMIFVEKIMVVLLYQPPL